MDVGKGPPWTSSSCWPRSRRNDAAVCERWKETLHFAAGSSTDRGRWSSRAGFSLSRSRAANAGQNLTQYGPASIRVWKETLNKAIQFTSPSLRDNIYISFVTDTYPKLLAFLVINPASSSEARHSSSPAGSACRTHAAPACCYHRTRSALADSPWRPAPRP